MKLSKVIQTTSKTAWVEFESGMSFHLKYVSRSILKVLTEQCTTMQYSPQAKTHQPRVDNKKLTGLFLQEAVLGWRGVSPSALKNYVLLNLDGVSTEEMVTEVEFSQEELASLVDNSQAIDNFLFQAATDVQCFNQSALAVPVEDATKNSTSTSIGS